MADFITQLIADLTANQVPSQLAFANGVPVVNPKYNGPAIQKGQNLLIQSPSVQNKIDDIFDMLGYQDQWMQRMVLPLSHYADKRRNQQ